MKLITLLAFVGTISSLNAKVNDLRFNPNDYTEKTIMMPDGKTVPYKAYEGIFYVTNVEDSTYQTMNIYVPLSLSNGNDTPIVMRTYVGGYMASTAKTPSATDVTGRALSEGYVVCIPGSRGSNSVVQKGKKSIYTGTAPNGLLDLKAAVRYLHYNDDVIPGSSNKIFTDGTSAGGAMSALLGATGNSHEYDAYLTKMGAAVASDDVFASICYCPITDLDHADMEYEWLYGCTNGKVRNLNDEQTAVSKELADLCAAYLDGLGLIKPNGEKLTSDNYKDYIKELIMASAHKALQEGIEIPDSIGFEFYRETPSFAMGNRSRSKDKRDAPSFGPGRNITFNKRTDFVSSIDLDKYLSYVASGQQLKNPPAFDAMGVASGAASPENNVFGNSNGQPANFTDYSLRHSSGNSKAVLNKELQQRIYIMNPMNFISSNSGSTIAQHWYIRHGAKDRDTSFLVPINLATKLQNQGLDVNFSLPWNRPHSGDYNLDELFIWIKGCVNNNK